MSPEFNGGIFFSSWFSFSLKVTYFIEVWLVYKIGLVLGIQQSDSIVCVCVCVCVINFLGTFPL